MKHAKYEEKLLNELPQDLILGFFGKPDYSDFDTCIFNQLLSKREDVAYVDESLIHFIGKKDANVKTIKNDSLHLLELRVVFPDFELEDCNVLYGYLGGMPYHHPDDEQPYLTEKGQKLLIDFFQKFFADKIIYVDYHFENYDNCNEFTKFQITFTDNSVLDLNLTKRRA